MIEKSTRSCPESRRSLRSTVVATPNQNLPKHIDRKKFILGKQQTSFQKVQRRDLLFALSFGPLFVSNFATQKAFAESTIESFIPEGIDFGTVEDPTLAYEFLYPKQYVSGEPLPITFYRKPVKYDSAAPQSVEGLQHIVCGLGSFGKGVVITVSVGPPPESLKSDVSQWTPKDVSEAVLSDRSVSRQIGGRRVPIASIENAKKEIRNENPYWIYESILTGSPTTINPSRETYRHSLNITSIRNGEQGTPFFYTLSMSCPQEQWEGLSPLFDVCAASFRLTEVTQQYSPPDRSGFSLF